MTDLKAGQLHFLSSSQDQNIHICKFDPVLAAVTVLHVCKGHAQSVDAIAVNPDGNKVNYLNYYYTIFTYYVFGLVLQCWLG